MAQYGNALAKKPASNSFGVYLTNNAVKSRISQVVGGKDGQRFITAITSAVTTNPALADCDNGTILSAALLGESLKLSPSPQLGQYYLVPFNDRKHNRKIAQFQLGYKGYVQLAERSGMYRKLNVLPIKEGELIRFDPLEEEIEVKLIEDEYEREQAPTCGYYAMFEYTNGFRKAMYWTRQRMLAHADRYSQAFRAEDYQRLQQGHVPENELWKYSSFWYKDFDGMACKTMLRQLISKWGVMSIDLQRAYEADDALIREDGTAEYVETAAEPDTLPQAQPIEVQAPAQAETPAPQSSAEDDFFAGTEG